MDPFVKKAIGFFGHWQTISSCTREKGNEATKLAGCKPEAGKGILNGSWSPKEPR
jgi:hypothetical protein